MNFIGKKWTKNIISNVIYLFRILKHSSITNCDIIFVWKVLSMYRSSNMWNKYCTTFKNGRRNVIEADNNGPNYSVSPYNLGSKRVFRASYHHIMRNVQAWMRWRIFCVLICSDFLNIPFRNVIYKLITFPKIQAKGLAFANNNIILAWIEDTHG